MNVSRKSHLSIPAITITLLVISSILFVIPADAGPAAPTAPPTVQKGEDFTHSVMLELFVTTWCDRCPSTEDASVELNMEYGTNFNFVSMITDVNDDADDRKDDFAVTTHPTAIFDGGYRDDRTTENETEETDKERYEGHIEDCGERSVDNTPVDLSVDVEDEGDGVVRVSYSATYTGTGSQWFDSHIRVYVTERVSRYENLEEEPIPYGFLDYAFDEDLRLITQVEQSDQTTIDTDSGDNWDFDNIVVVAAIFDKRTGVERYVVQTATTETVHLYDVTWDPEYPENTDNMTFRAEVTGDVAEVEVEYAICTEGSCGANQYVTMEVEEGTTYAASAGDFGSDAESIHFRIIVRDGGGKEVKSPLVEIIFGEKPGGGSGSHDDGEKWVENEPVFFSGMGLVVLGFIFFGLPLISRRNEDEW